MRRFLSLFMMLLLALRGLAGDAMAMESPAAHDPAHAIAMATMAVATHAAHDTDGDPHAHHAQAGHVMTQAQQCGSDDSSNSCGSHDVHCTTCGLCHSAMDQAQWSVFTGSTPVALQPRHGADRFASIAPIALIKPPISAV
jgi:hypothetical protein